MGKKNLNILLSAVLMTVSISSVGFCQQYVTTKPVKGEGIYGILRRYHLPTDATYRQRFIELNQTELKPGNSLRLDQVYELPVLRFVYDGKSIRSTLGISDYNLAKKIQNYNDAIHRAGLRKQRYTTDRDLWVPFTYYSVKIGVEETKSSFSLFGEKYKTIELIDTRLQGDVFYLVSGHGGPDPGAIGQRGNTRLYEDEYAYDITLRLARRLMEHGATVYMIVQDPNDGIRDNAYLPGDRDEYYYGGVKISHRQIQRLDKRSEIINSLYNAHKNSARHQSAIILHVDSQPNPNRIDIFYYYQKHNNASRKLAKTLYSTIKNKYAQNQPGRGYRGSVGTRELHVLRKNKPTTVYIELGNIKNKRDQDRFIQTNNRQAVANWLCDGLILYRTN